MTQHDLNLPALYNASEVLFHNLEAGRGSKIAVYWQDQQVTYAELADMANRIGNTLVDSGLAAGARVMMLLLTFSSISSAE